MDGIPVRTVQEQDSIQAPCAAEAMLRTRSHYNCASGSRAYSSRIKSPKRRDPVLGLPIIVQHLSKSLQ